MREQLSSSDDLSICCKRALMLEVGIESKDLSLRRALISQSRKWSPEMGLVHV